MADKFMILFFYLSHGNFIWLFVINMPASNDTPWVVALLDFNGGQSS
jgi:hypothetical protein